MTRNDEPLRAGIELEFPARAPDAEPLTERAVTGIRRDQVVDEHGGHRGCPIADDIEGDYNHEHFMWGGPYGVEARTPDGGLPVTRLPEWYESTISTIERRYDVEFEPCGLLDAPGEIATVGLHTHLSPLTYDEAQRLYELSRQPWFQIFCGSSVTRTEAPVTRADYAGGNLTWQIGRKGACVGERDDGHYEWRLPEPMLPENFRALCQFIEMFVEDFQNAENFARGYVESGSDELTSIRRARATGHTELPSTSSTDATNELAAIAL